MPHTDYASSPGPSSCSSRSSSNNSNKSSSTGTAVQRSQSSLKPQQTRWTHRLMQHHQQRHPNLLLGSSQARTNKQQPMVSCQPPPLGLGQLPWLSRSCCCLWLSAATRQPWMSPSHELQEQPWPSVQQQSTRCGYEPPQQLLTECFIMGAHGAAAGVLTVLVCAGRSAGRAPQVRHLPAAHGGSHCQVDPVPDRIPAGERAGTEQHRLFGGRVPLSACPPGRGLGPCSVTLIAPPLVQLGWWFKP